MPEGRFRRALRRLAADDDELAAERLQRTAEAAGATPVAACPLREKVVVRGTVQSTTLRPLAGAPATEAEIYDGSGSLYVVWLGRRRLAGIHTGVDLQLEGRIGMHEGRRTMFNPVYSIIPPGAG